MRSSTEVCHALIMSVALSMLADCSGGSSQMSPTPLGQVPGSGVQSVDQQAVQGRLSSIPAQKNGIAFGHPVTTPSFMDRGAVGKPLVFITDPAVSSVDIYLQGGTNKMIGQVTGFGAPTDIATDVAGDLYVQDNLADDVTVFTPPYTNGPKLTLHPGVPLGVAVSSQGVVGISACTNQNGAQCIGPKVVFYAPGKSARCAVVPLDHSIFPGGLYHDAFDGKGNLYVEGVSSTDTIILAKIDGGCSARKSQTLTLGNTISIFNVGGIKIDKNGRIAIVFMPPSTLPLNRYSPQIDTYDPPKGGTLGYPFSTTILVGLPNSGPLAFRASGDRVWVGAYYPTPPNSAAAGEFTYPAGGAESNVIYTNSSLTPGVAVTPPLVP